MSTETETTETKTNEHHADTNSRAGNGKIARLPRQIRETLNRRLADNEPGETLLAWLNGLPEVQAVLARDFEGKPITKQNLSEWRNRSFQRWQARQELLEEAEDLAAVADETAVISRGDLLGQLSTILAVRYAAILMEWNGPLTGPLEERLRTLHRLCQDITALRRGEIAAARHRLASERQPSQPPMTGKEARGPKTEVPAGAAVQASAPPVKPSPSQSNQTQPRPTVPALDLRLEEAFEAAISSATLNHQKQPSWVTKPQSWKVPNKAAA